MSIPKSKIDFFKKSFDVADSCATQMTTLELYEHKKRLREFTDEEVYMNHALFPHVKPDGRSYKIAEYRTTAPWYLQELIDDINSSKNFSELRDRRPRLAGLGEKLALAAGYSAKNCISQFKEAVKIN